MVMVGRPGVEMVGTVEVASVKVPGVETTTGSVVEMGGKQLEMLGKQLEMLGKQLEMLGKQLEMLSKQQEMLRKALQATGKDMSKLNRFERELIKSSGLMNDEMIDASFSSKNAGVSLDKISKQADKNADKTMTQTEALTALVLVTH